MDIDTASWKFQGRWAARLSLALNTDHKPCFFLLTGDSWAVCWSYKPRPIAAGQRITAGRTAKESGYHQINGRAPRRNFQTVGQLFVTASLWQHFQQRDDCQWKTSAEIPDRLFLRYCQLYRSQLLRSNPNFWQHWSTITFPKWPILPSNTAGP